MLDGRKPLAMFYAVLDELPWEELIPEEAFAPHVAKGRMSREEIEVETTSPAGAPTIVKYVFYALKGEEWRMQLMAMMVKSLHSGGGWNETCERIQGALLGYTPEENDAHCAQAFSRNAL
jgi:hypothetical protein